ncbi:MAG: histidine kinase [Dermatophilaceae bacterium]
MWSALAPLIGMPAASAAAAAAAWAAGLRPVALAGLGTALTWPGLRLVAVGPGWHAWGAASGPAWTTMALCVCMSGTPSRLPDARAKDARGEAALRRAALGAGVAVAVLGWCRDAVYEPFDDPRCHVNCVHSPMALTSDLALSAQLSTWGATAAALAWGLVLVMLVVRRSARVGEIWWVPWCVALLAAASLAEATSWLRASAGETPEVPGPVTSALHVVAGVGVALVLTGLVLARFRLVLAMERVSTTLEQGRDAGCQAVLAGALHEPALAIGHHVGGGVVVDRSGRPLGPLRQGRVRTELVDGSGLIGVIDHDAGLPADALLVSIGDAARIAIRNEGLQLRLELEVAALRESRRRILEHGDAERSRLERDLHDGAQQKVLALAMECERLRRLLSNRDEHAQAAHAQAAVDAAELLLHRLRAVARGLHPAVLDAHGLRPALLQLADSSPDPFLVEVGDVGPLPEALQRDAYAIVRDATLTRLEAVLVSKPGDLSIEVSGSWPAPESVLDRVSAAGGRITRTGQGWEATLPCE